MLDTLRFNKVKILVLISILLISLGVYLFLKEKPLKVVYINDSLEEELITMDVKYLTEALDMKKYYENKKQEIPEKIFFINFSPLSSNYQEESKLMEKLIKETREKQIKVTRMFIDNKDFFRDNISNVETSVIIEYEKGVEIRRWIGIPKGGN